MKNTPLLIILVLLLSSSCNTNDDNRNNEVNDPIIGKWIFGDVTYTFNNGEKSTIIASECTLKSNYEFKTDNTFELISYIEDTNDECELESSLEYAVWSKISTNSYLLTTKFPEQDEEVGTISVIFPSDKTMIWIDDEPGFHNGKEFVLEEYYFTKE